MQIVSCKVKTDCKKKGDVRFTDFSLLGFKRSTDETKIDMYFLFNTIDREFFIIKESFLIDKKDKDNEMAYLNHPLHQTINIDKYNPNKLSVVMKIMEKCNATNSYYSDFIADDIINNEIAVCKAYQFSLNGDQFEKTISINIRDYMKIQVIKNCLVFKLPLNPSIDSSNQYDNIELDFIDKLNYLGSEVFLNKGFVNYYSMRSKDTSIGTFIPVNDKSKVLFAKNFNLGKFKSLYKDNYFQIDMRNVLILDWAEEKKRKRYFAIIKNQITGTKLFIFNKEGERMILDPYSCL